MNRLGDLERSVMEVLWDADGGQLSGRQVADRVPGRAYTTILTILDRLRRKGLVHKVADARTHLFEATGSRESYMAELMIDVMGTSADREAVLQRFVQSMSADEVAALRSALSGGGDERRTGK
jgi:predicted transcriptional regulator